jgi:hypothetical protein
MGDNLARWQHGHLHDIFLDRDGVFKIAFARVELSEPGPQILDDFLLGGPTCRVPAGQAVFIVVSRAGAFGFGVEEQAVSNLVGHGIFSG